tara:strand:+ start:585 stop:1439 length:855 start_codon:yes stop_codon:yes gene_type:complete
MSLHSLINKIIPFLPKKTSQEINKIIQNVLSNKTEKMSLIVVLKQIDDIIVPYKKKHNANRQNWICGQIVKYFELHKISIPQSFVDIGGGNGNVLHFFAQKYFLPKDDCICIEKKRDTLEKSEFQYEYSHIERIKYVFLTEKDDFEELVDIDKKVDCILCMVSLHHMTDEYILNTVFPLIRSKLKAGGYLLFKEHNANSSDVVKLIEWEHHLYYLVEQSGQRSLNELENYANTSIGNYKDREFNKRWIEKNVECQCIETLNNIFERGSLDETPTQLYWQIFRKK